MPGRDWRTVGELLADSDTLARETLLDVSADQGPAMLRTWGQVVQSAARLWSVLPPASVAPSTEPDLMIRLQAVARGIGRSVSVNRWPGPGATDERLSQIAYNLSRAANLVERFGRDVQPTTPDIRADIAAARSRVMHALYVGAHGTTVALTEYQKALRDRLEAAPRRNTPLSDRPNPRDVAAAQVMINRLSVFEQLAAAYVAAHPVTLAALGEVAVTPRATRLQSALAGWDIQVHRTLASQPNSSDLVRVGRVQALIAAAAGVVAEAATERGKVDSGAVQRLTPTLEASQVAWTLAAKRWSELTSPDGRADPALIRAASEVRAAVAATTFTQTGWATPDQLAGRIDLAKTVTTLELALVASVDVAYLTREIAAIGRGFTAPAQVIAMRAQGEAQLAIDQGKTRYEGEIWATPSQVAANRPIPLPVPVRRGLVNLADDVIVASNKAVTAASPLNLSDPAHRNRAGSKRCGGAALTREVPNDKPNVGGPRR